MKSDFRNLGSVTASASAIALMAVVYSSFAVSPASADNTAAYSAAQLDMLSTPEGITLQALGKGQGWDLGKTTASVVYRDEVAYADSHGMTLYTYDLDLPGKSTCVDECAQRWLPATVLTGAKTLGEWSVITRDDGIRQWAYKDKPLYTYVEDVDPGSRFGNSDARTGAKRVDGAGNIVGGGIRGGGLNRKVEDKPVPENWHPALLYPATDVLTATATGLGVEEILDASTLGLVDSKRHTLYVFDGNASEEAKATADGWTPLAAPSLAFPSGDFSVVYRDDGISQWAYKGKGLYTYADDQKFGDAYGIGVDDRWQVATVKHHFVPQGVTLQPTLSQGFVWANSDGMTLYKRDGHIYQSGGGHSLHRGQPHRPAVGRDIGIEARCIADCKDVWHPFLAPADAQPQGYWDVYTREDGTKQWAYMGYALWTYDVDQQPGDMRGHDTYNMEFAFDSNRVVDVGTPMDGVATLVWAIAHP